MEKNDDEPRDLEMTTTSKNFFIENYEIETFHKSDRNDKKYYVVIFNKSNPAERHKIYFGAKKKVGDRWVPYQQYRDTTPLRLYSRYDHGDVVRLAHYMARHAPFDLNYINANTLSLVYLWHP